jgi:C_GCAxxG_C_C family probable redox protein
LGESAIIEDDERMLTREETARTAAGYAEQGFLCSEAVLMAIGDLLGFKSDAIPRIATGFGAGIGRRGEVCGAASGGVMGLGLRFGRDTVEGDEGERRPYWYAAEFMDGFRAWCGGVRCRDLLVLDLSRPEDVEEYHRRGCWDTRCRELIETAAGLAHDLLASEPSG